VNVYFRTVFPTITITFNNVAIYKHQQKPTVNLHITLQYKNSTITQHAKKAVIKNV